MKNVNPKIAVVGLGYVGLPLAVEFGKIFQTFGFDINEHRINELISGIDKTLEVSKSELKLAKKLKFTNKFKNIKKCNFYIITVPTPIDDLKKPDLNPLTEATQLIAKILKKNDIVVYESTVYPGATEEVCVPILEEISGLVFNKDFFCGYSPERINPGDKEHNITSIKKITSGSTPEIADQVDDLYKKIILAGTYKAESIKVAEAAKVIENTQRDVNIALVNELALIFKKMDIDTQAVLNAAATKWNFLKFWPGLVGGHCIGVDPYYLTHKALEVGYNPEMILAGRKINDNMGKYIVNNILDLMKEKKIKVNNSNVLIMGLTFKENCPDLRNTKVIDLVYEFKKNQCNVDVYDPWVIDGDPSNFYEVNCIKKPKNNHYDAIVLAVAHNEFAQMSFNQIKAFGKDCSVIYDIKYLLKSNQVDGRL